MGIIIVLHSVVRFVLLLVAVVGIVKVLLAVAQKNTADKLDATLASAFTGLYDLQALLGILIIFLGGLGNPLHPIVMFIGVFAAHGLQMMVKRAQGSQAQWLRLALYIVPLAIILVGLAAINHLPV